MQKHCLLDAITALRGWQSKPYCGGHPTKSTRIALEIDNMQVNPVDNMQVNPVDSMQVR